MKALHFFIDRLPEIGGASGALGVSITIITWESILTAVITALIFTFIGGIVGYFVKIGLDRLLKKGK